MVLNKVTATLHLNNKKKKNTREIVLGDLPVGNKEFTLLFMLQKNTFLFDGDNMQIQLSCALEQQLAHTVYVMSVESSFSHKVT